MPRREYTTKFAVERNHRVKPIIHEAFRLALEAVRDHIGVEGINHDPKRIGYAWVEVPPCAFTRWCKSQWPEQDNVFPGFFGVEGAKGVGRSFMQPGNRTHVQLTLETELAGAAAFARAIYGLEGLVDLRVCGALGARP